MYQPPHHREDRLEVQHALIRAHPLGMLVTLGAVRPRRQRASVHPRCVARRIRHAAGASRARQHSVARLRCEGRGAGRSSRASKATSRRPGMRPSRRRKGRADLELRDRAGVRPAAGHRGSRLAQNQIGALTASRRAARRAVGGERRARELRGGADQRHRRHRDPDRADRGQVEGQPEPSGGGPPRRGRGLARMGDEGSDAMAAWSRSIRRAEERSPGLLVPHLRGGGTAEGGGRGERDRAVVPPHHASHGPPPRRKRRGRTERLSHPVPDSAERCPASLNGIRRSLSR